uniref:DNA internalization-related competence protein ComEC/Rec2 n=1 Tax=Halomonas sp. TaxID=1486246 RepID=UPI0026055748|nr:DNA internalization-related competence protein ComEC/Rec2 [Halomonas sp.]
MNRSDSLRYGLAFPLALGCMFGGLAFHMGGNVWEAVVPLLAVLLLSGLAGRCWPMIVVCLAALWVMTSLLVEKGRELADGLTGRVLIIDARVLSSDLDGSGTQRLVLQVDNCQPLEPSLPSCASLQRVRVSHYPDNRYSDRDQVPADAPEQPRVGERWRLEVKLWPPWGMSNPGTFDYQGWLWREGIQATGKVVGTPVGSRLAPAGFSLRQSARNYLYRQPLDDQARRWLAALTLGDGDALSDDDWDLLNATGTTHLVVVSGLHVGLVAVLVLWLAKGMARLLSPGNWRMQMWPWWVAGVAVAGFVWMVGGAPPAMRALVMTLVAMWVAGGRHHPSPWQALALALGLVVLINPLSLWRPGLWLSFSAVFLLVLIWQGRRPPAGRMGPVKVLLRTQLLLSPLVSGLVLISFGRLAWVAPVANLFAVPVVSMLLVPLGMLGWSLSMLWPPIGLLIWQLDGVVIDVVVAGLAWLSTWETELYPDLSWRESLGMSLCAMALIMGIPGMAPRLRWGMVILIIASGLFHGSVGPRRGEFDLVIWDVGQGLMAEVRTARHRLLFDTGPRSYSGFVPATGILPPGGRFDAVVVSHADLDHSGGVDWIAAEYHVSQWFHPQSEWPERMPRSSSTTTCERGKAWHWDDVEFRFLWPPSGDVQQTLSSNDRSCVLEVTANGRRIIIPGDAGKRTERYWMRDTMDTDDSARLDVLVLGHHGSRTSTGVALVEALQPAFSVVSAGRFNTLGHPSAEVVRRLRHAGSCFFSTALDGQLHFMLRLGRPIRVGSHRRGSGVGGRCHGVESGL